MKSKFCNIALLLLLGSTLPFATKAQNVSANRYAEVSKYVEIFNATIRELDLFYVDSISPKKTIETGIINMLGSLDPYTNYIDEEGLKDFKTMTTGDYAGVGSYITARKYEGKVAVMISEPYENMPAYKAGLKTGDIILEIDGEDMTKEGKIEEIGQTLSSTVSNKLKGQAGTIVKLKIARYGEKKPFEKKLVRENIHISSVPYFGKLSENVGYIVLTNFTDNSAKEVKKAIEELKKENVTSLVFDLRGNGGGIVDDAVQIVNYFVPKGEIVVSTKGKLKQIDRIYRTTLPPLDTEIPIVVLTDRGTASSSEILAGAIQDMDRGVIIGQRTFGKGLVQTTRELPFGTALKVTTSKYYIPSGRCVQAIDYANRNEDGSVGRIPENLTSIFKTKKGRDVRDGGGITPDIAIEPDNVPSILFGLIGDLIISDFTTEWVDKHKTIVEAKDFTLSDQDYESFVAYVKNKKDFTYGGMSEKTMSSLKEVMKYEGYLDLSSNEFEALEAKLKPNIERDLEAFKDEIKHYLSLEIVSRYYGKKGYMIESLKKDKEIEKAIEVLNNSTEYNSILAPKVKEDNEHIQQNTSSVLGIQGLPSSPERYNTVC